MTPESDDSELDHCWMNVLLLTWFVLFLYLSIIVCICAWCTCAYTFLDISVWGYVCMYICAYVWIPEVDVRYLFYLFYTLLIQSLVLKSQLDNSASLASWGLFAITWFMVRLQMVTTHTLFQTGAEDMNCSPVLRLTWHVFYYWDISPSPTVHLRRQ